MTENYTKLNVDAISFDTDNPRIKIALEKYGEHLNAERIHFALRSASDGEKRTSSFTNLRDSIRTSGRAIAPISVVIDGEGYKCIDGNTRLAIYKQFLKEQVDGNWAEINAIVLDNANQRDIEAVRVSAHLVGAREWPAYEKARYLHYLRNQELMDYTEMIALCGGNKTEIERQIDAFHDMNEFYRDVVDDSSFHIDRFSGFVELQKPQIKKAIFEAGLDLKDFGEWIRDGQIYRLADVRQLPKVLQDVEARNVFLEGGPNSIQDAIKLLDQKSQEESGTTESELTLDAASIFQLARVLSRRIQDLPYSEVRTLKNKESDQSLDRIRVLEELAGHLQNLLDDVTE